MLGRSSIVTRVDSYMPAQKKKQIHDGQKYRDAREEESDVRARRVSGLVTDQSHTRHHVQHEIADPRHHVGSPSCQPVRADRRPIADG
jgi:hypothetical protein